ncbi:MAG TPA: DUF1707 domain-containing protein [Gemmatimonadaceae bacterium]|nr:DUF1707 domain-containing protein [Gemmatimonadaceae bacterium]
MSLELEREQTIQLLCKHFAQDQLSTQDLETRLEAAYRATTQEELNALVAGLPAVIPEASPPARYEGAAGGPVYFTADQKIRSIFGNVKKTGEWEAAERIHARVLFGNVDLDFREARVPPVTTVTIDALFSAVRIVVPPGMRVECDGTAVFGNFEHKATYAPDPGTDAPMLRVTGSAVFGNVEVVMKLPK